MKGFEGFGSDENLDPDVGVAWFECTPGGMISKVQLEGGVALFQKIRGFVYFGFTLSLFPFTHLKHPPFRRTSPSQSQNASTN